MTPIERFKKHAKLVRLMAHWTQVCLDLEKTKPNSEELANAKRSLSAAKGEFYDNAKGFTKT